MFLLSQILVNDHRTIYNIFVLSFWPLRLEHLTLKALITTAADDIHKYFSLFFRENKT